VLEVNGKEVGRKARTENGVYEFEVEYQRGKILARAIKVGKEIGTHEIVSEGKAEKISLVKEESYIPRHAPKPSCEIIYVDARITDKDGKICTQANNEITYEAEGADILGVGSGELTTEEMYTSNVHRVYNGKALIVLKKHEGAKTVTLKASTNGLISAEITI
jgi:beta-galactosidase